MEEEFYAVIKLISGEEIFSKVSASDETNRIILVLFDPITITKAKTRQGTIYKIEPWLKNTTEDTFIIEMDKIITIVESNNDDINDIYDQYIIKKNEMLLENESQRYLSESKENDGDINEARIFLEKIFNNSN